MKNWTKNWLWHENTDEDTGAFWIVSGIALLVGGLGLIVIIIK